LQNDFSETKGNPSDGIVLWDGFQTSQNALFLEKRTNESAAFRAQLLHLQGTKQ
jgi:hypothetical protein